MTNKNSSTFLQGMIVGIIVGVLIAVLMIFITRDPSSQHVTATSKKEASKKKQTPSVAQNPPGVTPPQTPDTTTSAQQDSQYDFYKILPADSAEQQAEQKQDEQKKEGHKPSVPSGTTPSSDKEKTPSKQEMANLAPAKPSPAKTPQKEKAIPAGHYWIQTGAFRSRSDAERTKARLALLGLEAKITSSNGWYRVRVGPLDNNQAAKTKKTITQNGMEAHLIKEN